MTLAPHPICRITWVGGVSTLCHPRHLSECWADSLRDRLERFEDCVWEIVDGLPRLMGITLDGTRVVLAQVVGEARGNFVVRVALKEGR